MAQALPAVLSVGGSLLSAGGSIASANAKAADLRSQAAQLEVRAGLERASSQRRAIEEKRQAGLATSRGLAVAAASGGGVDDPTVVRQLAGIEGEGEYRALSALYEGEETARGNEAQAEANRKAAKGVKTAGLLNAAGSILSGGASMFDRYGK